MHINAKSSGNTGEVQSESSTTILPQTNMLAAPLIPCPSPVTLTVSKKPFISHRNPSPSSGSETNTTNINNIRRNSAGQREYRRMMGGISPFLQQGWHVHHRHPRIYAGKI